VLIALGAGYQEWKAHRDMEAFAAETRRNPPKLVNQFTECGKEAHLHWSQKYGKSCHEDHKPE
jgi:hypothetical protein